MGCDIHCYAEKRGQNGFEVVEFSDGFEPFGIRSYGVFGFMAGVRNYSAVTPISEPRGLPDDVSAEVRVGYDGWGVDAHSASWLSVKELAAFGYDAEMEDRRVTRRISANLISGAETAEPGGGERMSYREFLGPGFFESLRRLQEADADRVVFWFDN